MSRQLARLAALYRTTQGASVASMPRLFRDAGASSCEGCRSSYPPVGLVHPWCARNQYLDPSLIGLRSRWAPVPLNQRERPKVQSVSGGRPPRWLVSTSVSEVSALRETCNRALVPGRWGACPDPRDQDQAHRAGGSLARVDHRCERSAYPWGAAEHLRGCRTRRRPGVYRRPAAGITSIGRGWWPQGRRARQGGMGR
jgi:hypothetical protein